MFLRILILVVLMHGFTHAREPADSLSHVYDSVLKEFTQTPDERKAQFFKENLLSDSRISLENRAKLAERALNHLYNNSDTTSARLIANRLGTLLRHSGNFSAALTFYRMSNTLNRQISSGFREYVNIGNLYRHLGDNSTALKYYKKANRFHHDTIQEFPSNGYAWSELYIGYTLLKTNSPDSAIMHLDKAIANWKLMGEDRSRGAIEYCYYVLANYHLDENKQYTEALRLADSIAYYNRLKPTGRPLRSLIMAKSYLGLNELDSSLKWALRADSIASNKDVVEYQILEWNAEIAQILEVLYTKMKSFNRAYYSRVKADSLSHVLKANENRQVMALHKEQNEKFRIRREEEIKTLRERQRKRLFAAGGGFLFVISALLFMRLKHVRRTRRLIQDERDRSDSLLLNILPEQIAEELKEKGESDAKLFDQCTVLFTDFRGFTAMSEMMTPEELVRDLNECFSEFDRITSKHGVEKIKTIGDSYMAVAGLPTPSADHAKRVILAAIEMAEFIEFGKRKKIQRNEPFFMIRLGIHTGPVVAGIVGVKKFQFDIWGDTVNTASRMESSGEVGKVNISQSTYDLVKDDPDFEFEARGKVEAKGKGLVNMWFVKRREE